MATGRPELQIANDEPELQIANDEPRTTDLCYLDAARVDSPAGSLEGVRLQTRDERIVGQLDGVLIDPSQRRLRYFVVKRPGLFRSRRVLLPADQAGQIETDEKTLTVDLGADELEQFDEFDRKDVRDFSDDDLLTAMFSRQVA